MRNLLSVLLVATASSSMAFADDHMSGSGATNFILIDYGFNLQADADENEAMPHGPDETLEDVTELLIDDGVVDDNSGFGIGVGHRYSNNIAAVLRYETGELESGTINVQIHPGSEITQASINGNVTIDVTSFMLEGVYFMPYSESVEFWGMLGIGQTELKTSNVSASINSEDMLAICSDTEDNTSTRFGVGATYYLSQTNGFYGGIAMSNYGDVGFREADGDACGTAPDSLSVDDVESTDFRIGYFRSF
jgi:hypothetical protein